MPSIDIHGSIDAVWRIESPKLIASLTRIVRDIGLAEDLAQDALVAALEQWPKTGVPDNPGAWLMSAAKNKAIDHLRHGKVADRVGPSGEPILLLDQNRARWDPLLIRRGLAALERAEQLGGRGPYMLQA